MRKYIQSLFVIFSLLLFSFLFSACSMSGSDDSKVPTATASVDIEPKVDPDSGSTTVTASRNAETFVNATIFNEDLAFASFCMSVAADNQQKLSNFFDAFEFDDFEAHNGAFDKDSTSDNKVYDDNKVADSISYGLAHCKDEDCDVIAVAIRGGNYGMEWVSNFELGTENDHAGFSSAAKMVYDGLKKYIDKNYSKSYANKTLKIWITGYSRAAAVSDVLSYYILNGLDDTYVKLDIDADDVFVYTFATPRALCQDHSVEYANVFNLYSKADLVTYVAPKEYGFYRCGTDKILFDSDYNIDCYKENKEIDYKGSDYTRYKVSYTSVLDQYLKELHSDIELPEFCKHTEYSNQSEPDYPGNAYKTEKECIEYFFNQIFSTTKTGGFDLTGRDKFVETAQPTIQYLMKLYMENSDKLPKLIDSVKADFSALLPAISNETNFCNFVKEKFTDAGITTDSELETHCKKLFAAVDPIYQNGSLSAVVMGKILPLVAGGNQDFQRIIKMHYQEVTYVTLIKYLALL